MPAPIDKVNLFSESIKYGHNPPKFHSPQQLADKITEYFQLFIHEEGTEPTKLVPTITGLALFLGFESRQSLYDYKNGSRAGEDSALYSYIVKKAMLKIEELYEQKLSGTTPTGAIFALKNMNWTDKTEVQHSGNVRHGHFADLTDSQLADRLAGVKRLNIAEDVLELGESDVEILEEGSQEEGQEGA